MSKSIFGWKYCEDSDVTTHLKSYYVTEKIKIKPLKKPQTTYFLKCILPMKKKYPKNNGKIIEILRK